IPTDHGQRKQWVENANKTFARVEDILQRVLRAILENASLVTEFNGAGRDGWLAARYDRKPPTLLQRLLRAMRRIDAYIRRKIRKSAIFTSRRKRPRPGGGQVSSA